MAFRLNKCSRCNGDLRLDRDEYGWYEQCIICGYMRDLEGVIVKQKSNVKKDDKEGEKAGYTV